MTKTLTNPHPYRPCEVAQARTKISNAKNDDNENLTWADSKNNSSHGAAALDVRAIKINAEINKLMNATDESDLEEMAKEFE